MIHVKKLAEFKLASDFVNPNTGTHFPKGSTLHYNTEFKTNSLGSFSSVKPNPIFIYLKTADDLSLKQKELLNSPVLLNLPPFYAPKPLIHEKVYSEDFLLELFQVTVSGVIHLFCALESFVNQQIPNKMTYKKKGKKYNYHDIQRWVGTEEKLAKILFEVFSKDITADGKLWPGFKDLKKVRDELVHLKMPHEKIYVNTYDELFHDLVDTDLSYYLSIVVAIMNFYVSDFVEGYEDPGSESGMT